MLRKQLILRLGLVAIALIGVSSIGIWLLRDAIHDLGRIDAQRPRITAAAQDLAEHMADLESALLNEVPAAALQDALDQIDSSIATLEAFLTPEAGGDQTRSIHAHLDALATTLRTEIATFVRVDEADSDLARNRSLHTLVEMRRESSLIPLFANDLASAQRAQIIEHVHTIAGWLGIAVIVLTAAAGLVLYSAARLVLKPVSALLKVSRELSRERYDARVPAGQPVEFAELASAYNLLADRVQQSDERTLETLQQLALTLNHELNNAFAIVEIQLERLKRQSPDDATLSIRLKDIRETLARMAVTVKSLTNLKRVVLTEYLPGQKMLDLPRSVASEKTHGSKEWTKAEVMITPGTSQTSTRSC
jgi:HAMP domain-containing protein